MQIELIGCTSAGKSTLIHGILKSCQEQDIEIFTGDDFVLKKFCLNWTKGYFIRRLLGDFLAIIACLINCRKNFYFYIFTAKIILQLPGTVNLIERIMIARNVLRNVGVYEIIQGDSSKKQIILLDEGTLHTAHYLFVHVNVEPKSSDISTFVRLIPLPDVAIYLQQDAAVLIERTLARGHKRIPDNSYELVEYFIKLAVTTFDNIIQFSTVQSRLLMVNPDQNIDFITRDYQKHPSLFTAFKILRLGIDSMNHTCLNNSIGNQNIENIRT